MHMKGKIDIKKISETKESSGAMGQFLKSGLAAAVVCGVVSHFSDGVVGFLAGSLTFSFVAGRYINQNLNKDERVIEINPGFTALWIANCLVMAGVAYGVVSMHMTQVKHDEFMRKNRIKQEQPFISRDDMVLMRLVEKQRSHE